MLLLYVRKTFNMGPRSCAVFLFLVVQFAGLSVLAEDKVTVITTNVLPTEHLTGKLRLSRDGIRKRENTLETDVDIENDESAKAQTHSGRSSSLLSIGEEAMVLFTAMLTQ